MSKERAKKIKLILFDVDGVMTDGTIFLFPAPAGAGQELGGRKEEMSGKGGFAIHSQSMIEAKGFNAHDGTGISLAKLGGLKLGIITKRISEAVALRARDLRLDIVHQGISDKGKLFGEILESENLKSEQVAYVGDDVIDLPIMRRCGLAIAVRNAREEVKDESHFITDHDGGHGACRDAIEYILRAQGSLERVIAEYIHDRSPNTPDKAAAGKSNPHLKI
jgi:3-deoxy-D-manno-octulosonate 8-phosphate phosphatase (KDO 8-P phosphatase)